MKMATDYKNTTKTVSTLTWTFILQQLATFLYIILISRFYFIEVYKTINFNASVSKMQKKFTGLSRFVQTNAR